MLRITSSTSRECRRVANGATADSRYLSVLLIVEPLLGYSPDFSDRDRRDLYIRGLAGRSSADRTVRPSSEVQPQ